MYIKFDNNEPIQLATGINEFNGEELHIKVTPTTSVDSLIAMAKNASHIGVYADLECTQLYKEYEYFNRVISTTKLEPSEYEGGYVYIILKKQLVDYKYYEAAKILFGEEA